MSTILVVEDDNGMRQALCEVLADFGHRVDARSDGAEALDYLRLNPIVDVVVLDIMMPRMNGYEFRRVQRSDSLLSAIPIIVCTAQRNTSDLDWVGTRVLPKPLRLSDLLRSIDEI